LYRQTRSIVPTLPYDLRKWPPPSYRGPLISIWQCYRFRSCPPLTAAGIRGALSALTRRIPTSGPGLATTHRERAHRDRINHSKNTRRHSALSVHACISADAQAPPRSRRQRRSLPSLQRNSPRRYDLPHPQHGADKCFWGLRGVQNRKGEAAERCKKKQ
jgi:hypothetical protein